MATITKVLLSGSTNGKGIKIAATATLGTAIHTAVSGTTSIDEVWLWAVNHDGTSRLLTIEFGGVTVPDNIIEQTITTLGGQQLVIPGLPLQNGLAITGFAAAANEIEVYGFINRYIP